MTYAEVYMLLENNQIPDGYDKDVDCILSGNSLHTLSAYYPMRRKETHLLSESKNFSPKIDWKKLVGNTNTSPLSTL